MSSTRKISVGHLTDCYTPVLNGVTHSVRDLKANLEGRGHEAPVFTVGRVNLDQCETDVLRSPGVPLAKSGYYAAFWYSQRAQARLAGVQVLHVHHPFFAGRMAMRYADRFGQPMVYTNHTRLDHYCANFVPRQFLGVVTRALCRYMRAFTQQCDLVIAPSKGLAQVMRSKWGIDSKVVVVPNGIDVERFTVDRVCINRASLGLPADQPVAVFTGRLGAEKNVDFLIRAYACALPEPGTGHLLLIGDGPRSARLRELAARFGVAERVTFAGAVPRERIPDFLAAADFFATASTTEVHPLSVLEALAAGLPVVGTISPGLADTITHGVDGLLTAPELPQYTAALRALYVDPDFRSRLSHGAHETGARYDIGNTTGHLLGLYRRALAGSGSSGATCD